MIQIQVALTVMRIKYQLGFFFHRKAVIKIKEIMNIQTRAKADDLGNDLDPALQ